jgi:hypothetical protein
VCAAHPARSPRQAIIGDAIRRFHHHAFESFDPDPMKYHSTTRSHGDRPVGFGPLAGSWSASVKGREAACPQVGMYAGQEDRGIAPEHRRVGAMKDTGAGSDRGGRTP